MDFLMNENEINENKENNGETKTSDNKENNREYKRKRNTKEMSVLLKKTIALELRTNKKLKKMHEVIPHETCMLEYINFNQLSHLNIQDCK